MTSTGDIAPVMLVGNWMLKKRRQKKQKDMKVQKEAQELVDKALAVREDMAEHKPETSSVRDKVQQFLAEQGVECVPSAQYSIKVHQGPTIRATSSQIRVFPIGQNMAEISIPSAGNPSKAALTSVLAVVLGLAEVNKYQTKKDITAEA